MIQVIQNTPQKSQTLKSKQLNIVIIHQFTRPFTKIKFSLLLYLTILPRHTGNPVALRHAHRARAAGSTENRAGRLPVDHRGPRNRVGMHVGRRQTGGRGKFNI